MDFGQLQTYLSQKLKSTETISSTEVQRKRALNDSLLNDVQYWCKWRELIKNRPLTFLYKHFLICGNTSKTVLNYVAVTDGSFRIELDGVDYNIDGLNFSACTSYDEIAQVIETGMNTVTSRNDIVGYYNDSFVFQNGETGVGKEIGLLETSTGVVGTDISGTTYLNGDSTTHSSLVSYTIAEIPNDYGEMVSVTDLTGSLEYSYLSELPRYGLSSGSIWTKFYLFDKYYFRLNGDIDITLNIEYRVQLVEMENSSDRTGLSSRFDEAIVLLAVYRLLVSQNISDQRSIVYKNDSERILDNLYVMDKNSTQGASINKRISKINYYY